ncbi:MAG: glycosyltransferase [Planctomycetes bacterium]|nr:glycosyltransferase [Planctomycetota bacterium]
MGADYGYEALRLGGSLDPEQFDVAVIALHDGPFSPVPTGPHVPIHQLGLSDNAKIWNPLSRWKLSRLGRALRPDCLCTVGPQARLLGIRTAQSLGIPSGIALIDDMGHDLTPSMLTSLQEINQETPRFVATSFAAAQRLVRQEFTDRNRIDVIPHGIDFARFPERTPESIANAKLKADFALGDYRALARIITAVQRDDNLDGWTPPPGSARVIGITGAPGVGKSSFIGRLGQELRRREKKVAVVAVDPSSPITGGALLGDRLRMMHGTPDDGFFIRSLSSRDVLGGLGPCCRDVIRMLVGFGFDYVLLETVGAGQSDVAVRDMVDKTILLLMPESGDAIQFSKAGIMEIADCFVINKCDIPGADATEAQLKSSIGDSRPTFRVTTIRDEGIAAVADWLATAV